MANNCIPPREKSVPAAVVVQFGNFRHLIFIRFFFLCPRATAMTYVRMRERTREPYVTCEIYERRPRSYQEEIAANKKRKVENSRESSSGSLTTQKLRQILAQLHRILGQR